MSAAVSSAELFPLIGDINCGDVDIDAFEKRCRIPLFKGKVNRWILKRTNRDDPSDQDIIQTLRGVMARFFRGSSDFGQLIDPVVIFKGTIRAGNADLVNIAEVSRDKPLSFPRAEQAATLSDCDAPITVRTDPDKGEAIFVEVEFAYRGGALSMPWPVHKVPPVFAPINANCPEEADWALVEVGKPVVVAPPEKSTGDKAGEVVTDAAGQVAKHVTAPLVMTLGIGLGLYLWLRKG